jgi:hypothetical protein
MDSRKEKYLDKIVEHLVNRTKYDTDHLNVYIIKFPFSDTWEVFGSDGVMSSIYDIYPKRFENYRWKFDQEMIEVFDLIEHESDYVWEKYFEGARFFGKEYANSDGLINESVDKKKDYLDKILERLKSETEFKVVPNDEPVGHKYDYYWKYPFSEFTTLSPYYPTNKSSNFHKHCRDIYGLSNEEIEDYILPNYYNWFKYNNPIYKFSNVETLFKNTTINESVDKQKEYLDKVVNHFVERFKDVDGRPDSTRLINSMDDFVDFGENFGLTNLELNYIYHKYKYVQGWDGEDKSSWYLDKNINESVDKQKKLLDYVYNDLVNNTKFRNASYRDIDIFDGKCKSLQVGMRWGSESPYFNYVPECLENFLKDTYGLTYYEIQDLFWDKYEQHIINMVLSKKEHVSPHVRVHVDYLRESKIDEETEYLKKVVDIMIRDTKPLNGRIASVVTPFIASNETNDKFVLSAHRCKEMVDHFDHYIIQKFVTDYLEMFGLSYEEMEEVMYWYFNDVYEKYFKRFFDDSYKTRPRLDEGIDLGFVDKVVDMVLREIVWDFDRGLVYFPMINYSASIRDDDFLSPLASDDAFNSDIGSPNTIWHTDLMDHIYETYGITGGERNRIWGSLQGEIWEKTEEYWNSFTKDY